MNYFKKIKGIAKADGMPERLSILIAAQCAHETGNFTSNVFKKCNNVCGYKWYPPNGSIYQEFECNISPEGNAYGGYKNIDKSVHELTAWIKRRYREGRFPMLQNIYTAEDYVSALKRSAYFTDNEDNYLNGIKRALDKYAPGFSCHKQA